MYLKLTPPLVTFFFLLALFCQPLQAEDTPSIETLIRNGELQLENGNSQYAFDLLNQAFRIAPDNIEVNYKLGQAATAIKDYESAAMAFERVIIGDPDFIQAKIEMAKSFYHLGAILTAKQYFAEVLETEDLPEEVRNSIASFLAGM